MIANAGLTFTADTSGATRFGFDAVEDKGRRKPPVVRLRSEDDEATPQQRGQLITLTRDIRRNFTLAAWAIRKHLDYVSTFTFQSKIGDDALDDRIEELIAWWGRAANFDVAGRHGLRRHLRLAEAHRALDGDFLAVKLDSGKVQSIEGDRVRTPTYWPADRGPRPAWVDRMRHGLLLDKAGATLGYAVHRRGGGYEVGPEWMRLASNSFTFERLVPAEYAVHLAYYDRFDQTRGISPFASALNPIRDVYEGLDYALAKAKIAQMVALKMTGFDTSDAPAELDWGRGPVAFKLGENENVELLQGNTPTSEWQAFINFEIAAALKAFDIPFLFYDESIGNYSKDRSAWLQYDNASEQKREDLREYAYDLINWRLAMFVAFGTLELPRGFNVARDLKYDLIANRVPWIDPLKEVQAYKMAANTGFDSTPDIAMRMGKDAYELADKEAAYQNYRQSIGLPRTDTPLAPVPVTINEGAQ
jgi:capsid protein